MAFPFHVRSARRRQEVPIRALFAAGEPGAWYDPSDLSSMYRDSAGTTPAVVGQPVGLILDKRFGLARGAELATNGSATGTTGWSVNVGTMTNPGGTTIRADATGVGGEPLLSNACSVVAGRTYEVTFDLIGANNTGALVVGGTRVQIPGAAVNSGAKALRVVAGATSANGVRFGVNTGSAGYYIEVDNLSVKEIRGNHALQATSASSPTLLQDANGNNYLNFDGVDDGMATGSIDFTATDKMTVWAGVHKASDAALAMVCELSANGGTNNGAFYLDAPNGAAANMVFASRGTATSIGIAPSTYPAPLTMVLTGIGDIANDLAQLRYNGSVIANPATDQGAGTYGNYQLFVGRRNGTSDPFNGRLYSLIVRGAASSAAQIAAAEAYVNARTRAY